jgi:hypothetical protein
MSKTKAKKPIVKPTISDEERAKEIGLSLLKSMARPHFKKQLSLVFHIRDLWLDGDGHPPHTEHHPGLSQKCKGCRGAIFTESYRLTIVPGSGVSLFRIPEKQKD